MPIFRFGSTEYNYKLIKEDRKTLSLTVHPNLDLVLKCPDYASEEKIYNFLKRKWSWMNKQISFFEDYNKPRSNKEFVSGESIYYLGRQYQLIIKESDIESVVFSHNKLYMYISSTNKFSKQTKSELLYNWFLSRAGEIFFMRFREMLKKFNYSKDPLLKIRNMQKRWGSYLSNQIILLNPKLIHTPKDCIDYVIVHELCHLRYPNHSKEYWKFLDFKYPKWEKVKDKLESYYFKSCDIF